MCVRRRIRTLEHALWKTRSKAGRAEPEKSFAAWRSERYKSRSLSSSVSRRRGVSLGRVASFAHVGLVSYELLEEGLVRFGLWARPADQFERRFERHPLQETSREKSVGKSPPTDFEENFTLSRKRG